MPIGTIFEANEYEAPKPGHYPATFVSCTETENVHGKALRWAFKTDDGKTLSVFSDLENRATTKNKTGRFYAAISSKPLVGSTTINTDDYIGRKYLVIVVDAGGGKGKVETFSAMNN